MRKVDVVVLESPDDGQTLIKRVVAGPGDVLTVRAGRLALNGAAVAVRTTDAGLVEWLADRPHGLLLDRQGGPDYGPVQIPADAYLVMGDNRGNSHDGRLFGFVPRRAIYGRAVSVWWNQAGPTWRPL